MRETSPCTYQVLRSPKHADSELPCIGGWSVQTLTMRSSSSSMYASRMEVAAEESARSTALMASPSLVATLSGWSSGRTPLSVRTCN